MRLLLTAAIAVLAVTSAKADLILVGPTQGNGAGLGNRSTVLTIQGRGPGGTESGCVGPNLDTANCGIADDSVKTGNSQIGVYTMGALGLIDFADLRIVFNAAEPGNAQSLTLDTLELSLWNGNAQTIFSLAAPVNLDATFLGVGQEGYLFRLDDTQAALANAAANGSTILGLGAIINGATGGPETFSFAVQASAVPEPSTWMLCLGAGMAVIGTRKFRKQA
jgi:hypothetical protein